MEGITPMNYRIILEPDLDRCIFFGTVEITLRADSPVSRVRLDMAELAIWSAGLRTEGGLVPCAFRVEPGEEALILLLPLFGNAQQAFWLTSASLVPVSVVTGTTAGCAISNSDSIFRTLLGRPVRNLVLFTYPAA